MNRCFYFKSWVSLPFIILLYSFEGIHYQHSITKERHSVHILEVDPLLTKIVSAHAYNQALGRQTVLELAKNNQALAAINGGFYRGGKWEGLPSGILKIQNTWFALPYKARGAMGWSEDGQTVLMDRVIGRIFINLAGKTFPLDGLNRPRLDHEKILFSSSFNLTTLTHSKGIEIILRDKKVVAIREGGNHSIPSDGCILSIGPDADIYFWKNIPIGLPVDICVQLFPQFSPSPWDNLPNIVGGTPLLIHQGKMFSNYSEEQTRWTFLHWRYPRTAVGLLPNGHWVFVIVDGNARRFKGMTINELALFMKKLGCIEALNLDGGGSSTMVIANRIVNTPVGDEDEANGQKKTRQVGDAILILPK
jgi:uncharacterized protein YigE (DUF2233 family)